MAMYSESTINELNGWKVMGLRLIQNQKFEYAPFFIKKKKPPFDSPDERTSGWFKIYSCLYRFILKNI